MKIIDGERSYNTSELISACNLQDLFFELQELARDFTICRYSGYWEIRDAMLRPIAGLLPRRDLKDVLSTYLWMLRNPIDKKGDI